MLITECISKVFYKNTCNENTALSSVDMQVKKGDFITIIGSNGAGKSTLLNCIAGVYPVNNGKIWLNGREITSLPEYKRANFIGRVFQNPLLGTSPEMTIEENLSLALSKSKNMSLQWGLNSEKRNIIKSKLKKVELGLEDRMSTKVKLLSGGQRQSLTLLMATLADPELLLLDEHTAALDPATAIKIKNLTVELINENNITTLMVTHNMKDAINMGNRLIMMDEGKIILDIRGNEKKKLTIKKLLNLFQKKHGGEYNNDRTLLSI